MKRQKWMEKWCVSSACTICWIGKIWHRIAWMMKLWAVNKLFPNQTDVLVCNIFLSSSILISLALGKRIWDTKEKNIKWNLNALAFSDGVLGLHSCVERIDVILCAHWKRATFANGVANLSQGKFHKSFYFHVLTWKRHWRSSGAF